MTINVIQYTYYVKECHLLGNPKWGENFLPLSCILFTYDINKRRERQGVDVALIVYSKYTILYTHGNCQNVSSFTKDTDFYPVGLRTFYNESAR